MLTLVPQPDGTVAISDHNGTLLGYARDQAHAEDWAARYEQALKALAPRAWAAGRALWRGLPADVRRAWSQGQDEQAAA